MSDTETDLSSNSEEENDGGYSREESFVKDLFTVYFLSEANSSGIKSCRNGMDASANEVKIQIYNTFQIGVNKILLDSILHHASLDETTISILKDEAMRDVEIMSKTVSDDVEAVDIRLTQSTAHDEPPAEQMQSASASISSDGDASTMSNGSSEVLASNNVGGLRREREPSEDSDNPRPQQRRRGNKSTSHTIAAPLSFDEATFKEDAKAQVDAIADKFASFNNRQDRVRPIAFEARLLQMMQCKIKDAFTRDEPNLKQDLYNVLRHTFQVLKGNDMCREKLVNILRREAEVRDSVQSYSDAQSHGDLLNLLRRTRDQNDDFNLSLDGAETEVTSAVQQWINSDSGSSEAREVSTDEVKEFSIHRKSAKNAIFILLKLCTAATVISQFSMKEALLHSPMCIQDLAADLYRVKCGSELDSSSVNLLQFIQKVIIPLLKERAHKHKWKAVKLTLEIRELLTNSTRVDRQRESLQEVRKALILEKFRSSQRQSLAGDGRIVGESVDYFGADQPWEKHTTERRNTMTPFFNLLLAETIEGKMPPRLLQSRGGFALAMLRMSWSDLTNKCNFASKAFLGKDEAEFCSTYSEAYLQKKKKLFSDTLLKVKKQKNDTSFGGEKKLIIFSTEQMQSLVVLADYSRPRAQQNL